MTSRTKRLIVGLIALLATLVVLTVPPTASASPDVVTPLERSYTPTWHKVHYHLNAYDGSPWAVSGFSNSCSGTSGGESGSCHGKGEMNLSADSFPFGHWVDWSWNRQRTHCPDIEGGRDHAAWPHELRVSAYIHGWQPLNLCGFVSAGWTAFRITGGSIGPGQSVRYPVQASNGHLSQMEHTKGGPLFVFYQHRNDGYVLGLRGWLYY